MILTLELAKDPKGNIKEEPALYRPSQEVVDRTNQVMKDFGLAWNEREKPYEEFNFLSLVDRINIDRRSYNQFVYTEARDAADSWKSRAFRPIVRNKIITIAAHITAAIIYPKIYAQNERDEEDRDAAMVMRDLMEWCNDKANYDYTFIQTVLNALIDPVAIVHTEYAEKYREIKERVYNDPENYDEDDKGKKKWKIKKVLDELYSGFQDTVVPADQLYIANFYEPNIQKQPFLIWRKVIDYSTAQAKYKGNKIFEEHVTPGIQFLYSDQADMFYRVYDQELQQRLVEEVIYYNREADLQLTFINGILIDDVDNPNPRKDKKYPFASTGYENFDSRFFYFKSLAYKLVNDEEVINILYRMIIDGTYLQIMPPSVIFGAEEIGSSVIAPGVVTTIDNADNPNASWQTLATNNNLTAGLNMLEKVEASVSESSASDLQQGEAAGGSQTAFEISRLEQNARVMFGMFAKMVSFLVRDFGYLRVNDIIQYMTVADVMDIESPQGRLRFKNFVLPERVVNGKNMSRKIEFDGDMPDEMTPDEKLKMSFDLLEKGDETKMDICKVNPTLFRKMKFMIKVQPEALFPKSDSLNKALMLEEYAQAMMNPLTNKESITRDLLLGAYDATKDDPDAYMQAPQQQMGGMQPALEGGGAAMKAEPGQPSVQELAGKL